MPLNSIDPEFLAASNLKELIEASTYIYTYHTEGIGQLDHALEMLRLALEKVRTK